MTLSLNAFAVSDGNRHGAVIITTGLLAALDRRELTGVVAHEIGHIRNRDSRVILVAVLAVGAVVAVAAAATAIAMGIAKATSGFKGKDSAGFLVAVLALIAFAVALVLRLIAVPAALLLRAALSRRREQLADASAVQFTRDPGGLRRALEKLAVDAVPLRPRERWLVRSTSRLPTALSVADCSLDCSTPIRRSSLASPGCERSRAARHDYLR